MTTPDWNKNTTLDHASALALYERATVIDPWPGSYPPNDTGSDGISVCKAAVEKKLIVSYDHTFNFTDALLALVLKPVMFGTNWYDGMFTPTSTGEVKISGSIAGGHEWTAIGIDVKNAKIRAINSWGSSWGNNGYFYVSFPTLQRLLSENGDCTVPRTK
jgi:hypothetical protein